MRQSERCARLIRRRGKRLRLLSGLTQTGGVMAGRRGGVVVCALLLVLNHLTAPASIWSLWVTGIWCALLVIRGMRTFVFRGLISRWQRKRLRQMLRR